MDIGPVDVVEIAFPGNDFNGEVLPALQELVASGTVRILDLLFAFKTADGEVGSIELAGLTADHGPLFTSVDGDIPGGLLDTEDVDELGEDLRPGSSILFDLLGEHLGGAVRHRRRGLRRRRA